MKLFQICRNEKYRSGIEYGEVKFTVKANSKDEAYFKWLSHMTMQEAEELRFSEVRLGKPALGNYESLKQFKFACYPCYVVREILK